MPLIGSEFNPLSVTTPTCPSCSGPMQECTARRGRRIGKKFWGCMSYPHCKGTLPYSVGIEMIEAARRRARVKAQETEASACNDDDLGFLEFLDLD